MKIERYEACKDSDITWLGSIPTNWNTKRLQDLSHEIGDGLHGTPKYVDSSPYYFINGNNLSNGRIQITDSAKCISKDEYQQYKVKLDSNSILLSINGTIGNLAFYGGELIALGKSAAYIRIKPNFNKIFIYYFLQSEVINTFFNTTFVGTTIRNLSLRTIRTTIIPVPSLEEQVAIAHYLDTTTAQIERKIDLLTQKATLYSNLKQSLINETVTRGLDKTVPMKDSGVKWIGEVPEHWKVTAIANITTTVSIKNYPDEELLSVYRDYGVIIKNTRDDNHNKAGQNLDSYKLVEPGYLVINKMKAWQGSLGVSEFRGIVSPAYITCRTDKRIIERGYLHHLLRCRTYINEYNRLSYGVRVDQWDMRYDDFKYVPVLLPPLSEQKTIADYLDTKTAQIDQIIQTINTQIEKLKELRRTLINDVVTGKIKVVENEH